MSILTQFVETYASLNANNVDTIAAVYGDSIVFEDPLHRIEGLDRVMEYMAHMYANVSDYQLTVANTVQQGERAFMTWRLAFVHPKLNAGELISFDGVTELLIAEKIVYHKDYYDVGSMLYEHVPLLGAGVRWLKRRAAQ